MAEHWPGDSPSAWIDDIGHAIAERYRRIEDALRETLERLAEQHLDAPDDLLARYAAIRELRTQAERLVRTVDPDTLARWATEEAASGASAEIARQLLEFPAYTAKGSALTAAAGYAVAAVELDLRDALRALNARILRAPADAYQAMTSKHIGALLSGATTSRALHRRILDNYLADGITGFVDKSDRRWTIGAYSEMATRSAAARAWRDQSVASMEAAGITTFTPVIGSSACDHCAPWTGKILTDSGPTGDVVVRHAITGIPTTIHVDATLAEWRASGAGHPNCRDTLVPELPGGPNPADYSTHDPQAQADREKLRELEREVRTAKREGDRDAIGEAQANLRKHVDETGIIRRSYREQLPFADGGDSNPRGRTVRTPRGSVTVPRDLNVAPHELATAERMSKLGHNVVFNPIDNSLNAKNPDVTINGMLWEFKSPQGSSERNTINDQFKKARKQADRVVIDLQRLGFDDGIALEQIKRRFYGQKRIIEMIVFDKSGRVTKLTLSDIL